MTPVSTHPEQPEMRSGLGQRRAGQGARDEVSVARLRRSFLVSPALGSDPDPVHQGSQDGQECGSELGGAQVAVMMQIKMGTLVREQRTSLVTIEQLQHALGDDDLSGAARKRERGRIRGEAPPRCRRPSRAREAVDGVGRLALRQRPMRRGRWR